MFNFVITLFSLGFRAVETVVAQSPKKTSSPQPHFSTVPSKKGPTAPSPTASPTKSTAAAPKPAPKVQIVNAPKPAPAAAQETFHQPMDEDVDEKPASTRQTTQNQGQVKPQPHIVPAKFQVATETWNSVSSRTKGTPCLKAFFPNLLL